MRKLKLGILISGRGSNMLALARACRDADFPAEIAVVVCNRPKAEGLIVAEQMGLTSVVVDHKDFEGREAFDMAVDAVLREHGVELVCLAGFMRLLTPEFVGGWRDRMINIHPSLLPAFKGLNTQARALENGVQFTGATVHYVRPEMDEGPIILQAVVPVEDDDTVETLTERILKEEHRIYVEAVRMIGAGEVRVSGGRVKRSPRNA